MTAKKVEPFHIDYDAHPGKLVFDYGTADPYPSDLYHFSGIAPGVDTFDRVTNEQIAQFHEQGYLVVNNAFTPAEVQAALDGLFDLISGQKPEYTGLMFEHQAKGVGVETLDTERKQDYVRKFMWFVEYDQRLKAMAEHPQLRDIMTRLLSDDPEMFQDMALFKPPHIGREKPWHQDHAYFDLPMDTFAVGVWIALDEATTDNGCMVIHPGSHRQGPVVHFQRRDWQICDTDIDNHGALAVPLQPGGCLFFHSLLHHGTPANQTGQRRRAVQFHYRSANAGRISVEERLAVFGAAGKYVTC